MRDSITSMLTYFRGDFQQMKYVISKCQYIFEKQNDYIAIGILQLQTIMDCTGQNYGSRYLELEDKYQQNPRESVEVKPEKSL